jgi:hypothetical protein
MKTFLCRATAAALLLAGCQAHTPDPGVKPDFVPCDPDQPERPCTPEPSLEPSGEEASEDEEEASEDEEEASEDEEGASEDEGTRDETPPGVKPRRVPCDPARPELPCTPEPEAPTPPGVKPRHVPCDPARPELPCTPEPPAPRER